MSVLDFINKPIKSVIPQPPRQMSVIPDGVLTAYNEKLRLQQIKDRKEVISSAPKTFTQRIYEKYVPEKIKKNVLTPLKEGLSGKEGIDIAGNTRYREPFPIFGWVLGKNQTRIFNESYEKLVSKGISEGRAAEIARALTVTKKTGDFALDSLNKKGDIDKQLKELELDEQEKKAVTLYKAEKYLDTVLNLTDFIGIGSIKAVLPKNVIKDIALSTSDKFISNILKREIPAIKPEVADIMGQALKNVDNEQDVSRMFDVLHEKYSIPGKVADRSPMVVNETKGSPLDFMQKPIKEIVDAKALPGATKGPKEKPLSFISKPIAEVGKQKAPTYEGEKDLTIKTLQKLEGKSSVSKQYISDLTNSGDLKQTERDIVRKVLEDYPEGKDVDIKEFASKVKAELLPLERNTQGAGSMGDFYDSEGAVGGNGKYESVTLPEEIRGDVADYGEHIYSSSIKTSAGDVHFAEGEGSEGYFGHTRTEDMSDGKTRRVIEAQSDLYQKGRLESDIERNTNQAGMLERNGNPGTKQLAKEKIDRNEDLERLKQYSNPTAHFRMAREEIKRAAEDGMTKLQFPTGETAMKIEGLGQRNFWNEPNAISPLTENRLNVGMELWQNGEKSNTWVVTDVLGDGKFKAVMKPNYDEWIKNQGPISEMPNGRKEQFDISGKVDTSNPIYKFYEKDLGRYLTNNYAAKIVTDSKGVKWYEVPITTDMAKKPVNAFRKKLIPILSGLPKMTKDQALKHIFADIDKDDVKVIFEDKLIEGVASGMYEPAVKPWAKDIIRLFEEGGYVEAGAVFEEAGHYLFAHILNIKERNIVLKTAASQITKLDRAKLFASGYRGESEILEEFAIKRYARERAKAEGYKGPWSKVFEIFDRAIKRVVDIFNKVKAKIASLPNKEGGFVKNPLSGEIEPSIKKITNDEGREMYKANPELFYKTTNKHPQFNSVEDVKSFIGDSKETVFASDDLGGEKFMVNQTTIDHLFGKIRDTGDYIRRAKIFSSGLEIAQHGKVASVETPGDGFTYYEFFGLDPKNSPGRIIKATISEKGNKIFFSVSDFSTTKKDQIQIPERALASKKEGSSIAQLPVKGEAVGELSNVQEAESNLSNKTNIPLSSQAVNKMIEDLDRTLEEKHIELEIAEEELSKNKAKSLSKYIAKTGENAGNISERNFPKLDNGIIQEAGFETYDDAKAGYEKYVKQKQRVAALEADIKDLTKQREDIPVSEETNGGIDASDLSFQDDKLRRHKAVPFLKYVNKRTGILPEILEGYEGTYGRIMKGLLEKKGLETVDDAQKLVNEYFDEQAKYIKMQENFLNLTPEGTDIAATTIDKEGNIESIGDVMEKLYDKDGKRLGAKTPEELIEENADIPVSKKVNIIDYFRTPERVLKDVGLDDEARLIRKKYEDYLKELPKNLDKITEWSKRAPGKKANSDIFLYLDGNLVDGEGFPRKLYGEEKAVADEIKQWLSTWANRLELPQDKRISNYITHIFEKDFIEKEFDADLAKIIADKVPGQVYDPFLEERLGAKGFKRDTWAALDAYAKRGTRKVHMDVALERVKIAADNLPQEVVTYVKRYADRINLRPTEADTLVDNAVKKYLGYQFGQRPVAAVTGTLRKMVYRALLGLNVGSAVRNLTQGVNTYAKLGEVYTLRGYYDFLTKGTKELEEVGTLSNSFIEDRSRSASKKFWENTDKVLYFMFELAEKINRGAAYYGGKAKALSKGVTLEEAVEEGKKMVRETQFNFGSVDSPVALQGDLVKTFTQFMSYSTKQVEFLSGMAAKKDIAGLVRFFGAMTLIILTIGSYIGMKKDWKSVFPRFNFDWPPALKPFWEIFRAAVLDAPGKYGNDRDWKTKLKDVGSTLLNFIPGSIQIKKTLAGIEAGSEGASYDKAGKIQYEVGSDPLSRARAAIFGKSTLEEAQDYYEKKAGGLSSDEKKVIPILKTYDKVQAMKARGEGDKANETVNKLSEEEYALYKVIKTYDKAQKLKEDDKKAEAKKLVDTLSDEEYETYKTVKTLKKEVKPELSGKKIDENELISQVKTYATAIGTDPATAFNRIFTGQKIRRLDNGTIIVERMPLTASQKVRAALGGDTAEMKLDHVVSLQLGGSNSKDNLKIVTTEEWKSYTPVENYLGKLLRAEKITKKKAQELIIAFKEGKKTFEEIKAETD